MTDTKHTPGQWKVFHKHKYDEWHVSVPKSDSNMTIGLFEHGIPTENPEADARLIACAPEILEMLEESVKMCRHHACQESLGLKCKRCKSHWDKTKDIDAAIHKCRIPIWERLIAKAKGETND
jgi:hypothetical protein